jgi:hypothetical protein
VGSVVVIVAVLVVHVALAVVAAAEKQGTRWEGDSIGYTPTVSEAAALLTAVGA